MAAAPVVLVFAASLLIALRTGRILAPAGLLVAVALAAAVFPAAPVRAHDPGQGVDVGSAALTARDDGRGGLSLQVEVKERCADLAPRRVLARRAGETVTGTLIAAGGCSFRGALRVPEEGRWFVYAELDDRGRTVETWLPIQARSGHTSTEARSLYRPAGSPSWSTGQLVAGVAIYAVGLALLSFALFLAWHPARRRAQTVAPGAPTPA